MANQFEFGPGVRRHFGPEPHASRAAPPAGEPTGARTVCTARRISAEPVARCSLSAAGIRAASACGGASTAGAESQSPPPAHACPWLALPGAMCAASCADDGAEHGNVRPGGVKREGPLVPAAPKRWRRGVLRVPGEQAQRGGSEAMPEVEIVAALAEENEVKQAALDNARAEWEWFVRAEDEEDPEEEEIGEDPDADEVEVGAWRREVEERAARLAQQRVEQERGEGLSAVSEGPRAGPKAS